MLTGQRAFKGEDTTDTIVAVVSKEPDWSALPSGTPAPIRRLLRRCLEKDRRRRLDSAADARLEIDDALNAPATESVVAARARRTWLPWALVAMLGAVLIAGLFAWAPWQTAPMPAETRLEVSAPAAADPTAFAISPDGRLVVFSALGENGPQLWLRSLSATTAQPLAGTEGVFRQPFWSPDSRSVGFLSATALKKLDLGGGAPQTLTSVTGGGGGGRGATWNADGVIVFAPNPGSPLMRASVTGGEPSAVTTLDRQQSSHRWPQFLPDGRRFLFYARGSADTTGIYLGGLDGGVPTRLTPADTAGVYLPSGWLAWVHARDRSSPSASISQRLGSPANRWCWQTTWRTTTSIWARCQ